MRQTHDSYAPGDVDLISRKCHYTKVMRDTNRESELMSEWRSDLDDMVVSNKGYTRSELDDAWDLIAPADNWKNPICTYINCNDFEICNEACIFFTGSSLAVAATLAFGDTEAPVEQWLVEAPGYYLTIGA
tara:strand:+ start:50 stop:442 length:393 start_codon:yes stop_codon:yes gene_type:complete